MADKTCIACAETIKAQARLCRFCGTSQIELTETETASKLPSDSPVKLATKRSPRKKTVVIASIAVASGLLVSSAIGAVAWQLLTPPSETEATAEVSLSETEEPPQPPQPLPSETAQKLEPEPPPPPPPQKSPQEILLEQHAAEMKRVCDIMVFHDWDSMDSSWGGRGHAKAVLRTYDDLNNRIGRVVSFMDFSLQYDRTMGALLSYGQIAEMYEEIDTYSSWEVAGPANRFDDQLNILWRMCGY